MKKGLIVGVLIASASFFAHADYKAGLIKTADGKGVPQCTKASHQGSGLTTVAVSDVIETSEHYTVNLSVAYKTCVKVGDKVTWQAATWPHSMSRKTKTYDTGETVTIQYDFRDYVMVFYDSPLLEQDAVILSLDSKEVDNVISLDLPKQQLQAMQGAKVYLPGFVRATGTIWEIRSTGKKSKVDVRYFPGGEFKLVVARTGNDYKFFTTK